MPATDRIVTPEMLQGLPEPVQRYRVYTGVVGKPWIDTARVRQSGRFRRGADQPWMGMSAVQELPTAFLGKNISWQGVDEASAYLMSFSNPPLGAPCGKEPFLPVVLLIIDVQDGLFHKSHPIYRSEQLLANLNGLIERARSAGAAVIFIQHANKQLVPGTPAWQIHADLARSPGDLLIHKEHASALLKTPLPAELEALGIRILVVSGLVTHGCVRATCADALSRGYRVILAADGHSSYSKDAASLINEWNSKLAGMGAEVLPAAEIDFTSLVRTI